MQKKILPPKLYIVPVHLCMTVRYAYFMSSSKDIKHKVLERTADSLARWNGDAIRNTH